MYVSNAKALTSGSADGHGEVISPHQYQVRADRSNLDGESWGEILDSADLPEAYSRGDAGLREAPRGAVIQGEVIYRDEPGTDESGAENV